MNGLLRRIAIPTLLLTCVAIEWSRGGDSLPNWLANLSVKTGAGSDKALRILIAVELCGALFAFLSSGLSRRVAWLTGIAFAFSGLAELSAIINAPGDAAVPASMWIAPIVGLAIGAGTLALLMRPNAAPAPRGRISALKVIGAVAIAAFAFGLAGRLDLAPRTNSRFSSSGAEMVVLNPSEWVGMTMAEAGIARHVPSLTPLTLEGTKWVVFYSPTCGRCHEVFRTYFSGPQEGNVIAVLVPHGPGVTVLPSDQPADVECTGCERVSLPDTKQWIITPPTIVKVENGRVTCVTSTDYDRCRTPADVKQ